MSEIKVTTSKNQQSQAVKQTYNDQEQHINSSQNTTQIPDILFQDPQNYNIEKKTKPTLLKAIAVYLTLILTPILLSSCSNDKTVTIRPKIKIEKPELETPKFAREKFFEKPQAPPIQPEIVSPPEIEVKKIKQEQGKPPPSQKKGKQKSILTQDNKKIDTNNKRYFYPDRNPKEIQELVSKLKFTVKDPTIQDLANKLLKNITSLSYIAEYKDEEDENNSKNIYTFYKDDKEIATIEYHYKKDKLIQFRKSLSNKQAKELSDIYYISETDRFDKPSRTHLTLNPQQEILQEQTSSSDYETIDQSVYKKIDEIGIKYPLKYSLLRQRHHVTKNTTNEGRNKEPKIEELEETLLQKNNSKIAYLKKWRKEKGDLKFTKEGDFIQEQSKWFYTVSEKNFEQKSPINKSYEYNSKFYNKGEHYLITQFSYKDENGKELDLRCISKDLDKYISHKSNLNYPKYKLQLKDAKGQKQTLELKLNPRTFQHIDTTIHDLLKIFKRLFLNDNFSWQSLENNLETVLDYHSSYLKEVKYDEVNPYNKKTYSTHLSKNDKYQTKTIYINGNKLLDSFSKRMLTSSLSSELSHELQKQYNSTGSPSSFTFTRDLLDKIQHESRLINSQYGPIDYSLKTESKDDKIKQIYTINGFKFYEFSTDKSKNTRHEYFKKKLSIKEKDKLVKHIEKGIDDFLNKIIKIYQKDFDQYGILKSKIQSVLKDELKKSIDMHLNLEETYDEYSVILAYIKAIEGIKEFFVKLCTERDYKANKSKLTVHIENAIPTVPVFGTYVLDPEKIEVIMRKIYYDLDSVIIPQAFKTLANHSNLYEISKKDLKDYTANKSFNKKITKRFLDKLGKFTQEIIKIK